MPAPASISVAPTLVSTLKSDSNANFVPLTTWLGTEGWSGVRPTVELASVTGDLLASWGYQTTNDRVNVSSVTSVGTARDANGSYTESGYTDLTTPMSDKQYVRFGAVVKNKTSGTTLEMCRFGGKLDFK